MKKKYLISIERLHLITGFTLVSSGVLAYFSSGIEASLSWVIFGAMYISMSDIGEDEMSEEKRNHRNHALRRLFGYFGAVFSVILALYYLNGILL